MSKKEKVLIAHNYYQIPGGEDTVVKNELELLQENGHEVLLYTRHNDEIKKLSKLGKMKLFFDTIFSIKTYREVRKLIEKEEIDVVHVHNTLPLISPSVYYAALSKKIPVVQTVHNFRLLCPGATFVRNEEICEDCVEKGLMCAVKNKCYRGSFAQTLTVTLMIKIHRLLGIYDKINYIALTDFNKEKLKSLVKDPERIFVKPNFMKEPKDRNTRETGDCFLFLGRVDKLKGIDTLVEAWEGLDEKLIVIGDGPERENIEKVVKEKEMKNVSIKGFMKREEALEYLKSAKALIVPSKCYEGLPMTIIEAFSYGIPVIGSKLGNIETVIEEEVTGKLFEVKELNDLKYIIENFRNNSLSRELIRKNYLKNYTSSKNYKELSKIYRLLKR